MPRHLVPGREDDAIAVAPGNAPLLVVVLVVGGVVVPAAPVRLEDRRAARRRSRRGRGRATRAELAVKHRCRARRAAVGSSLRASTGTHVSGRARGTGRGAPRPRVVRAAVAAQVRVKRGHRSETPAPSVLARDLERLGVEHGAQRHQRRLRPRNQRPHDASATSTPLDPWRGAPRRDRIAAARFRRRRSPRCRARTPSRPYSSRRGSACGRGAGSAPQERGPEAFARSLRGTAVMR